MQLHLISKSPFTHQALARALSVLAENDCLVLIDDGAYAATAGSTAAGQLTQLPNNCYVLQEDLLSRGITAAENIQPIDYETWVELVFQAQHTVSWY